MHIDTIITGQNVFTGECDAHGELLPARALALAISGGRIAMVSDPGSVTAFARECNTGAAAPRVVDANDGLVCAGFHDAHLHFFHSAVYSSPLARMFLGESEADCVARMQQFAAARPEGWLLAQGWREYRWNPPVLPSKASLDAAFPTRPVAMYSGDAHTLWLNSRAMEQLGLTRESVPPAGGAYDRDEAGELTGIVREAAAMELMPRIMANFTTTELLAAYEGFFATLARQGITSVCDMSLMANPGLDFVRDDLHATLLEQGRLTARVNMYPTLLKDTSRFQQMVARYTGEMLRVGGFKQFFDGVSSQHTAWVDEPYANARFAGDCGRPTIAPAAMRELVLQAAQMGVPVRIHTIGDAAIHAALDIFEEAQNTFGPLPEGRHHTLEHLENFQPADIGRIAKLGVVASVQPPHMTLDPGGPERDLGPSRVPYMWPFKALLAAGATLAFGTDSPVVAPNSMGVLYSAVTRQDPTTHAPQGGWLPAEKLTLAQALGAYTRGSAQAAGVQAQLGTLEVGKGADVAILQQNPFNMRAEDIQGVAVAATFVAGKQVFGA